MKNWGFAISLATCQPGNRSEYTYMLLQGPNSSGPRYADPPSLLRHWQLNCIKVLRY